MSSICERFVQIAMNIKVDEPFIEERKGFLGSNYSLKD